MQPSTSAPRSSFLKSLKYSSATERATSRRRPSFFRERNKQRTSALDHLMRRVCFRNRAGISAALHRASVAITPIVFPSATRCRRACAWSDHSDHVNTNSRTNRRQREGRRRVASDDQQLDAVRFEKLRVLDCVAFNCRERLGAVRHARRVAEINEVLVGQAFVQRAIDS